MYTHFYRADKQTIGTLTSSGSVAPTEHETMARFSIQTFEAADEPAVGGTAALLEYHEGLSSEERSHVLAALAGRIADAQVFFSRDDLEKHVNVHLNATLCEPDRPLN